MMNVLNWKLFPPLFLNGTLQSPEQAQKWKGNIDSMFEQQLSHFLMNWYSDSETMDFFSSGTTGFPKKIQLSKDAMRASAKQTISYFQLEAGEKIVLGLSPQFIGGAMMIVRAMEGGLHLYAQAPDRITELLSQKNVFSFASLVPHQLFKLVDQDPWATQTIFKRILLGGTALTPHQWEQLQSFPKNQLWMGYGMTETCSHIALRSLTDSVDSYALLPGIEVRNHVTGCLEVRGAITQNHWLLTSDLVQIKNNRLMFLGRADDVINSGGVKISPFVWENLARQIWHQKGIESFEFALTSSSDKQFGDALTLALVQPLNYSLDELNDGLPQYQKIKSIQIIDAWPNNAAGKLDRKALKKMID